MIWICDLRTVGDDVEVNLDLDLREFFGTSDVIFEERNDTHHREMRYFLLKKAPSDRVYFDVSIEDRGRFTLLGINQPGREMNLMPRFAATRTQDALIFFELHSGFQYPLIDGSMNLPQHLDQQLINNGIRFLAEKAEIFEGFHDQFIGQGFLNQETAPTLLFFNSHYTNYDYLAAVRLNRQDIDLLNTRGLHVYISEPILEENVESVLVYEPNILHLLNDLAKNNGLTNVNVHLCEHGFPNPNPLYPCLKFHCHDIFLRMSSFEYSNNGYPREYLSDFSKKFWSGNWIYKTHRHIIASHLTDRSANLSWHYDMKKCHFEEVFRDDKTFYFYRENLPFMVYLQQTDPTLAESLLSKADKLDSLVPVSMDNDVLLKNDVNDYTIQNRSTNGYSPSLSRFYTDSFCGIITETVFDYPYSVLSEKTLCCMINQRPFILVAPSGSLYYLKKLGFQTFDHWWDESYDQECSPNQRMTSILKLIDWIDGHSMQELHIMLNSMKLSLAHNQLLALSLYQNYQPL